MPPASLSGCGGFDCRKSIFSRINLLQRALAFIGSHFSESIRLADIVTAAGINHTTLTDLFNRELSMTPVGYLWHYRVQVAAKQLEFTSLPIKDISVRCGFKTVQHFSRKFSAAMGQTPSDFRTEKLRARIEAFGKAEHHRPAE